MEKTYTIKEVNEMIAEKSRSKIIEMIDDFKTDMYGIGYSEGYQDGFNEGVKKAVS